MSCALKRPVNYLISSVFSNTPLFYHTANKKATETFTKISRKTREYRTIIVCRFNF